MSETLETTLAGPAELLAKLLDGRAAGRRSRPEVYGNISDEGVRRLINLSYFASQAVEEGRYARFRLAVSPQIELAPGIDDPWQLLHLRHPVLLAEVDDLRRLAPCASSHDFALEVQELAGQNGTPTLGCFGLRMAHSGEGGTEFLSSSVWARQVRPGLMIRVDGPGELRVSEALCAFDLRAGKLVDLGGLPVQPIQGWAAALAHRLARKESQEKHLFYALHFGWNELLLLASDQGQGACFVLLPVSQPSVEEIESRYGIRLKYPTTGLGLGELLADFVDACSGKQPGPGFESYKEVANTWMRKRHSLSVHVKTLANLSGVDGCTVFDRDLRLQGFGGKILPKEMDDKRQLRDARANQWLNKDVLYKTGTRHLSAYQLCQACKGVTSFVVSQDGHVTLFWSDAAAVHRWAPYWPWAKRSDHY
jgi:hypothetical protein